MGFSWNHFKVYPKLNLGLFIIPGKNFPPELILLSSRKQHVSDFERKRNMSFLKSQ